MLLNIIPNKNKIHFHIFTSPKYSAIKYSASIVYNPVYKYYITDNNISLILETCKFTNHEINK